MKVIIPMAGRGTRLRPHTVNLPKPLMKIADKSMIEWIVSEIKRSCNTEIEEIHFIIGDFGQDVEKRLLDTASGIGSKGFIHYQREALGTAHALYCANDALSGEVFVVFADTIFKGKIEIDNSVDGIIWTMNVDEPEKYGVVRTDSDKIITEFVEKPSTFVSNNAIVGLYYFKEAEKLRFEINELVKNNARENNEFQLTNCLETLKGKNSKLKCAELDEWLDCGNKQELLTTHKRILEIEFPGNKYYCDSSAVVKNSSINSYVSVGKNVILENCRVENSIIYANTTIKNSVVLNSIVGNNCTIEGLEGTVFMGDYSEYEGYK